MSVHAIEVDPNYVSQKPKSTLRSAIETAEHLSGLAGLQEAPKQVGSIVGLVEKKVEAGATKAAGVAVKWGWKKLAAFCFKVAGAAPLIAKIAMGAAVIVAAVCIFRLVRAA